MYFFRFGFWHFCYPGEKKNIDLPISPWERSNYKLRRFVITTTFFTARLDFHVSFFASVNAVVFQKAACRFFNFCIMYYAQVMIKEGDLHDNLHSVRYSREAKEKVVHWLHPPPPPPTHKITNTTCIAPPPPPPPKDSSITYPH